MQPFQTHFQYWLQDFECGNGSSKQEIGKYFVRCASLNLLNQNSANWGSSNQGSIVICNFDSQQGQEIFLFLKISGPLLEPIQFYSVGTRGSSLGLKLS
jgi:hypothetical protein